MCIYPPIFSKGKKIRLKKKKRKVASVGDTYRRTRDATCARRRRVASSRRSRTRRVEPQLRVSEQAGQRVESGAILTAPATSPRSSIGRNRIRPMDATRARARNQFGGLRRHDAIATDRSADHRRLPPPPPCHLVAPSRPDSSLFTHTIARVPLAWFHR